MEELKKLYAEFSEMMKEDPYYIDLLHSLTLVIGSIVMDIRTCDELDCPCQPEKKFKALVKGRDRELREYLYPNQYNALQRYAVMA